MTIDALVGNRARYLGAEIVARLAHRVGVRHLEHVEDAVQAALVAALETWPTRGVPDNPDAWLVQVAHHRLMGTLRQDGRRGRILDAIAPPDTEDFLVDDRDDVTFAKEIPDALLRMIFVCCDASLPHDGRVVLALKTLCGLEIREIARRLFITEANARKRLTRARARLATMSRAILDASASDLEARRPSVLDVLSLLFTEGHLSSHPDIAVRASLCDEALRLAHVLVKHPAGDAPETEALVALMYLHRARLPARVGHDGALILLEEQDRAQWSHDDIARGLEWLARSARGDAISRFHVEASIAAKHCLAASFEETPWAEIVDDYLLLERIAPSPLSTLARAVAVAEWRGPRAGLAILADHSPPSWLEGSYMWSAVKADLHRRAGDDALAALHTARALEDAPSTTVRDAIARRLR